MSRRRHDPLAPIVLSRSGVLRYTVGGADGGRLEITCVAAEVDTIRQWLEEHGAAAAELDLPVPEQPEDWRAYPLGGNRWTRAASDLQRAYDREQRARRAARLLRRRAP